MLPTHDLAETVSILLTSPGSIEKSLTSLEIPGLIFYMNSHNLQPILFCQGAVCFRRGMEIRLLMILKIANPLRQLTNLFDYDFNTLAIALRNKSQKCLSLRFQCLANGAQDGTLFWYPMERVAGNDLIKLMLVCQVTGITNFKLEVGMNRSIVLLSEGDHVLRRINTQH